MKCLLRPERGMARGGPSRSKSPAKDKRSRELSFGGGGVKSCECRSGQYNSSS